MTRLPHAARLLVALFGLALVAGAWWIVTAPSRDLEITHLRAGYGGALPLTHVQLPPAAPEGTAAPVRGGVPGVLIAHGFGASRRIMLGYAYRLAYAGYGVMLWDFAGHGANRRPLDESRDALQENVDAALAALIDREGIDPGRIAIVGHSMGSGAAMRAGTRRPDVFAAVVAISPTGALFTEAVPRNLFLQAGSLEPRFAANAERLLAEAGGTEESKGAFAAGAARAMEIVPGVEHMTILFSDRGQQSVVDWLDRAFAVERDGIPAYTDRRALLYALHFVGWLLTAWAAGPYVRRLVPHGAGRGAAGAPAIRARWWIASMIGAPFLATGALAAIAVVVPVAELGGMLVAGAAALWFLVFGLIWLAVGFRPSRPRLASIVLGAGLFALLWLAAGLMSQHVALQWILIPSRLARWPVVALAMLPWQLAAGYAQAKASLRYRVGLYLAYTLPILAALAIAGLTVNGLFFLTLVLPALPVAFAATALLGGIADDPWAYAVGNALFLGWLVVAIFPLA